MNRVISDYSRGMRQRTKLAQRNSSPNPDFLILDEPFNGLDPIGRHDLTAVLLDWIGLGKSLLFAACLHEIEWITQSFLLICGGRLLTSPTYMTFMRMMVGLAIESRCVAQIPICWRRRIDSRRAATRSLSKVTRSQLATRAPGSLYERPSWLSQSGVNVLEMRSADESLQALFNSLMKIHEVEL